MFEYESLYNTKTSVKTFHITRWKCIMFQKSKVKPPLSPPPIKINNTNSISFLFNPVKFQESNCSQLFEISLFKDI